MIRSLLTGLLTLAFAAAATAQTTPVTTTTATSTTVTKKAPQPARTATTRKTATRKRPAKIKATKKSTSVVLPARAEAEPQRVGPHGGGTVGSHASADGAGQGVYAAPGAPVDVQQGKVESYDGPAPKRGKTQTTLTPSSAQ